MNKLNTALFFRFYLSILILAFLITDVAHAQASGSDKSKVNAAIQDIYATISGPAGKPRDWEHWKSLFARDTNLGVMMTSPDGVTKLRQLSLDEFISTSGKFMETKGFFEKEIHRVTNQYGHIVQVFSTYECRNRETDEKPMMRGINSIVLVEEEGKLKISSLVWEQESSATPIPASYLPSTK